MNDKTLSFIGLCKKAGCLALGRTVVQENIEKGKVELVLMSSDLSERSKKNIEKICYESNVELLKTEASMKDLAKILGKEFGIMGIFNTKMAKKINELVVAESEEKCSL